MTPLNAFLFGFACGAVPLAGLIEFYLVRARRRVRAIRASIQRYQAATKVVGEACDKAYRNQ